MHPVHTIVHWSHHMHDIMLSMRYHVSEILRSRHFWLGVGLSLLVVSIIALLFIAAGKAPFMYPHGMPYIPY